MVLNETPEIMEVFHEILVGEGYEVDVYPLHTGEIDAIERTQPQLVILDCSMGMHGKGWDLLQSIKSDPAIASLPLIVASTSPKKLDGIEHHFGDRVAVLPKPFDIDELLTIVADSLRGPAFNTRM